MRLQHASEPPTRSAKRSQNISFIFNVSWQTHPLPWCARTAPGIGNYPSLPESLHPWTPGVPRNPHCAAAAAAANYLRQYDIRWKQPNKKSHSIGPTDLLWDVLFSTFCHNNRGARIQIGNESPETRWYSVSEVAVHLEQIQLLLGHASVQTTERYLGTKQDLVHAPNNGIKLRGAV
jgi:hypothetical protein